MSKGKIIFIEDNEDNLNLVQFLLEEAGYEVLGATNGRIGLEMVQKTLPSLVLLDLGIPELNGWSLAHHLKQDPATSQIPIVALTAHTMPGDRKKALDAGCDGYISKPLNIPEFVSEVESYLRPKKKD